MVGLARLGVGGIVDPIGVTELRAVLGNAAQFPEACEHLTVFSES
jgi:hypothetical protein